jgi:hypothetical protein
VRALLRNELHGHAVVGDVKEAKAAQRRIHSSHSVSVRRVLQVDHGHLAQVLIRAHAAPARAGTAGSGGVAGVCTRAREGWSARAPFAAEGYLTSG